jgi:hypothetical protein
MANPNQREIDRLLVRLADAQDERRVWGNKMLSYWVHLDAAAIEGRTSMLLPWL